mgnify:CR=1 FL=1
MARRSISIEEKIEENRYEAELDQLEKLMKKGANY